MATGVQTPVEATTSSGSMTQTVEETDQANQVSFYLFTTYDFLYSLARKLGCGSELIISLVIFVCYRKCFI